MLRRNTDAIFRKSAWLTSPGSFLEGGISPSTHTHTHIMHTVYVHSQTTGARLHAVTLMNADASAPNATDTSAHTNTRNSFNRLSQLESVTKDAVCHKRVPLSPNINAQRTATSVLRSCFDLLQKIQPILHSF